MIRLSDPLGTPYLHDYQPLIDNEVDDSARREAAGELDARFDELALTVSEWEGRTLVAFKTISGTVNGGTFALDASALCGTATSPDGDRTEFCLEDQIGEALAEIDQALEPRDVLPAEVGFIVVERNGRWYLDAPGTLGFFSDQAAEASAKLADGMDVGSFASFGIFALSEGPVAEKGAPTTAVSRGGSAAVAFDLRGFSTIGDGPDEMYVALANVTNSAPGTVLSENNVELAGSQWIAAYQNTDPSNEELPAIIATTNGNLEVELFDVDIIEVGIDGVSGQLDDQGRPLVLSFNEEVTTSYEVSFEGVDPEGIWAGETAGTVLGPNPYAYYPIGNEFLFVVAQGEPGADYQILVVDPATEPVPSDGLADDEPFDIADFGDPAATSFSLLVGLDGYDFAYPQDGGYFDGCGPDDPDVTTYVFENAVVDSVLITPYPSEERALAAFEALVLVASPCESYESLIVSSVMQRDDGNVDIVWHFKDSPELVTYEHYRLVDLRSWLRSALTKLA